MTHTKFEVSGLSVMTYRQAFQSYLPRMIAEAAINNRIREYGNGSENDPIDGEMNCALSSAFTWSTSPEKRHFWETVNDEFLDKIE